MNPINSVMAFADFKAHTPLSATARLLSTFIFGGIEFVVKEEDIEHTSPTMRLGKDFMGIQAELFGSEDHFFSLELDTVSSAIPNGEPHVCDLSEILKKRLSSVPGVTVIPPQF